MIESSNTQQVVELLKEYGWKISAAESCTAGLFAAEIASVSGASEVLDMSFVTYSEDAKIYLVGVNPASIKHNGVVSEQVAMEMAAGVAKKARAEVGIGITGYAGPTGGDEKAPVGTICISLFIDGSVIATTLHLDVSKGRNEVRKEVVSFTMEFLENNLCLYKHKARSF